MYKDYRNGIKIQNSRKKKLTCYVRLMTEFLSMYNYIYNALLTQQGPSPHILTSL
jgi:hypothetical protein